MTVKFNRRDTYPIAEINYPVNRRAKWTGEFRKPLRGEWFLSGAIVEAYRAPNDLDTEYPIATIVECKQIWIEV